MSDMIRMSIDVPADLHKHAKMAAAYHDQTIREFVIEQIRKALARKPVGKGRQSKKPNRLTCETIEKSLRGEELVYSKNLEEFYRTLGI